MSKPSNFILNTDFATLQNDDNGGTSFIIPASIAIPFSGAYSYSASYTFEVGTTGASSRPVVNTSADPTNWHVGSSLTIYADGSDSILGAVTYYYTIYLTRIDASTVQVNVLIPNQGPGTLTTESAARTISITVATLIPPFSS